MSDEFLYLETTGRRSGMPREIEIWFVAREPLHYVVAEHRERAAWVRNIAANSRVHFSIGTCDAHGLRMPRTAATARLLDPVEDAAIVEAVAGLMEAKYRWSNGLIVELAPISEP